MSIFVILIQIIYHTNNVKIGLMINFDLESIV